MALMPCPTIGQLTLSPTRATFFPFTTIVDEAEMTAARVVFINNQYEPFRHTNLPFYFRIFIFAGKNIISKN
jgi:hypothetical protein